MEFFAAPGTEIADIIFDKPVEKSLYELGLNLRVFRVGPKVIGFVGVVFHIVEFPLQGLTAERDVMVEVELKSLVAEHGGVDGRVIVLVARAVAGISIRTNGVVAVVLVGGALFDELEQVHRMGHYFL